MALFLAIVLTVIASSSSNIGKAFQKEASRHLPPLNVADAKVPYRALSLSLSLCRFAASRRHSRPFVP